MDDGYAPHEVRPAPYAEPPSPPQSKAKRTKAKRVLVPRTRNGNTMTEAQFWGMLRGGLRRTFRFWKPIQNALLRARVPYHGPNKRRKWSYRCTACGELFDRSHIEIDHVEECGELTAWEHVVPFIQRLAVEDPDGTRLQALCLDCHKEKGQNHE